MHVDWNRELTVEELAFKQMLMEALPVIICRSEAGRLTGAWLNANTLKRDDSLGCGPRGRYEAGKKIIYPREALIDYGIRRFGIVEVKGLAA